MVPWAGVRRDQGSFVYRALVRLLRFALFVFFRQVVVVGRENVPAEGEPVIFVGNHPNSLIDPILLLVVADEAGGVDGRRVRFLAKDALWRSPFLRPILRVLGAIPVVRRVDQDGKVEEGDRAKPAPASVDNAAAFDAMERALAAGAAIGIFPEGLSHDEAQLQRLKTGAARIALGARARTVPNLRVIPCGLNYVSPRRFRSRVLVQFGTPVELDDELVALYASDERAAVAQLTARIDRALRSLTINATDWQTLRLLDAARRLYQPTNTTLSERIELSRRFAVVYPTIAHEPSVRAAAARLAEYMARLDAVGLDDRDLQRRISRAETARRLLRHLALALLWLPLALPGVFVHLPVGLLARYAGRSFSPRPDTQPTTQLVVGIALSLAAYGTLVALATRMSLRLGVVVALLLPLSGLALLVVLERSLAVSRILITLARLGRLDGEIAYLAAERASLELEVVGLIERFRPSHLVPMFPRDEEHV